MILANLLSLSQQHSSESITEMFFHQNVQPRYFNILDLTTRRIKDKIQNIRLKTEQKIPGLSPRLRKCKFILVKQQKQTLQQALESWSNFSSVWLVWGQNILVKTREIHIITWTKSLSNRDLERFLYFSGSAAKGQRGGSIADFHRFCQEPCWWIHCCSFAQSIL